MGLYIIAMQKAMAVGREPDSMCGLYGRNMMCLKVYKFRPLSVKSNFYDCWVHWYSYILLRICGIGKKVSLSRNGVVIGDWRGGWIIFFAKNQQRTKWETYSRQCIFYECVMASTFLFFSFLFLLFVLLFWLKNADVLCISRYRLSKGNFFAVKNNKCRKCR